MQQMTDTPPESDGLVGADTHDLKGGELDFVDASAERVAAAIEPERVTRRVVAMLAVLVLAALVAMLNETALTVAIPAIMGDFGVAATTVQWLTTGFMLTMAVVIPATGYLLQRFTTRALFTASLALFLVGTALAFAAPNFELLLLARVLQAIATAVILPQLMATTLSSVPARYRGTVMGLNAVVISAAPALGPTLAGFIVEALSWQWIFGLMLPVVAALLIAGIVAIRTDGATRRAPFEVFSVVLSAFAFGGIVYALSSIGEIISGAWLPLVALGVGIVALVAFLMRQVRLGRTNAALLDLAPFGVPVFRNALVIIAIAMATMLGTVMVLPIHMQGAMGLSTLVTGLALLPGGLIQGIISPIAGRIFDSFGARVLVIPGAVLLAAGQFLLSTLTADTSLWMLIVWHTMFCIGMAAVMTPLMTVSLGALPRNLYGHGSAIVNTLQQLAGAAGTAILVAAMSIGAAIAMSGEVSAAAAQAGGTRTAFLVGGVIALVAVVVSFAIRTPKAGQAPAPKSESESASETAEPALAEPVEALAEPVR